MSSKGPNLRTILIIFFIGIAAIGGYFLYSYLMTPKELKIRVITRHGPDILTPAKEAFLKSDYAKKAGITNVEWVPVDPVGWEEVIKESANKPGQEIDVGWGGGPPLFDFLNSRGLLSPITSDDVKRLVSGFPKEIAGAIVYRQSGTDLIWVGAAISSFGFTINLDFLKKAGLPTPNRWSDLSNETYAKTLPIPSVATADPIVSTSNERIFEIIIQAYGWEEGWKIVTLMAANARMYDESGLVRDAAIRGDVGISTTIDFYGYQAIIANPDLCKYVVPVDGSIVNADPIALLTSSKHRAEAMAFIAWVLDYNGGQKIWVLPKVNRMPIDGRVFSTPEGANRTDLKIAFENTAKATSINFSDDLVAKYRESLQWYYYATISKPHDKLQQTWEALALARLQGKIRQEDFARLVDLMTDPSLLRFTDPATNKSVIFSESFAISARDTIYGSVDYRSKITKAWYEAALTRYDAILTELKKLGV